MSDDDLELNVAGWEETGTGGGGGGELGSLDLASPARVRKRRPFNRKKLKENRTKKSASGNGKAASGSARPRARPKPENGEDDDVKAKAIAAAKAETRERSRKEVERREEREREAKTKELPRIYSHAQATTTAAGAEKKGGAPPARSEPSPRPAESDHEDDEVNSDIDEEGKGFIEQLLSQHFVSEEVDAKGREEKPVEPLNSNAKNFADIGLDQSLVNCLLGMGYEAPTGIQKSAIPLILSGKDVLAQSPTGSGKTVAYVSPIVQMLKQRPVRVNRSEGTLAIIIVPTRELSLQVFQVCSRLFKDFYWIVPGTIMGGEKRTREKARLRKGINVLTCTPGRLLDHLENTTAFQVSDLKYLILDEADRLIDMGFEEQVSKIIQLLDKKGEMGDRSTRRQTIMLSATMHSGVSKLAKFSLHQPVSIGFDIGENGGLADTNGNAFQMPKQLKQYYMLVPTKMRPIILYKLVAKSFKSSEYGKSKIVVFVSCCDSVEFHYEILNELSASDDHGAAFHPKDAFKLHGNMTQQERTAVYFDFCDRKSAILICTDVAARGLDFPSVTHIVQYDPPGEAEDYIHRVGRTARMQSKGEACLFLLPTEMPYVDVLRDQGIKVEEEYIGQFLSEQSRTNLLLLKKVNALFRDPVFQQTQRMLFDIVSNSTVIHQLAADAYRSFLRSYARYPSAIKTIFNVKVLHYGHVADSFGLKEKPSMIGKSQTKQEFKKRKNDHVQTLARKKKEFKKRREVTSE